MRTVGNIRIEQVNKASCRSLLQWYGRVCESTSQDQGPPTPQIKWFIFEKLRNLIDYRVPQVRDTARWILTGITWLHGNQGLWVGSDWVSHQSCPSIAKNIKLKEFSWISVRFVVFCRFRLMEIRLNIWNASTWQCWWFTTWQCRWGWKREDGGPKFWQIAPKSQTSNSRILQESKVLWFLASQLPTQAENLELLHSEPRILRVLLEVGPYLFPHGMLMKEKMRGLTWWKLNKVTERKEEAWDIMTKDA